MKKRHGRRGRIACFNNTACEQRVICVWMKITTRHSIPSQMPMQMIQWWTSADVHYPFYPSYFFFSDFPWRNSFLAFSSSVIFFFSLFLLFFSPLDRSRREIDAFDLSRYVEKLFSDNSYLFYDGWYLKRVLNLLILLDFDLWKLKIANSCIIIARWSKKLYNDWFLFSH